jgi:tetratricopeptide (TPR) repeat protein
MIGYCPHCRHPVPATRGDAIEYQCSACGTAIALGDDETKVPDSPLQNLTPPIVPGNTPPNTIDASPALVDSGRRRPLPRDFGDYELLEEIGHGGMGVVYKARHIPLDRILALKMIRAAEFASSSDVQRFHVEAAAAARLDHPNIVAVHEFGEIAGQHFFTMGFVEGGSLQQKLQDGPLSSRDSARLLKTIAEAVQYAHQRGIVHRDLKPSNVVLDRDGKPRVTDFGLAKRIEADSQLTETGQILGTPSYMPPEQTRGEAVGPQDGGGPTHPSGVGPHSDVYSLGAILYTTLTGRPPFQGATPIETIRQVQDREPELPRRLRPDVDRDLETICMKCLEKTPALRYGTAAELAAELDRFLKHEPVLARRASPWRRAKKWVRRHPMATAIAALAVTACVVVAGLVVYIQGLQREQANLAALLDEVMRLRDNVRITDLEEPGNDALLGDDRRKSLEASLKRFAGLVPLLQAQWKTAGDRDEVEAALAACLLRVGALRITLGRRGAEDPLKAARTAFEQLHRRNPANLDHLRGFIASNYNLGETLGAKRDYNGALRYFDEALGKVTPAIRKTDAGTVARLYLDQGVTNAHLNRLSVAETSLSQAESLLSKLKDSSPDDPLVKSRLGRAQFALGLLCVRTGRYPAAKTHYDDAIAAQQFLVRRYGSGKTSIFRRELIHSLTNRGQLLWQLQDLPAAEQSLKQAVEEARFLVKVRPLNLTYGELARATYHFASFLFAQRRFPEAKQQLKDALTAFAKMKDDKDAADLPRLHKEARIALMKLHLNDGEHAAAFKLIQLLSHNMPNQATEYVFGATFCARCANLAMADNNLNEAQRTQAVDEYARQAASLLKAASKLRYAMFEQLFQQMDWKTLRGRPEFQAFLKKTK